MAIGATDLTAPDKLMPAPRRAHTAPASAVTVTGQAS